MQTKTPKRDGFPLVVTATGLCMMTGILGAPSVCPAVDIGTMIGPYAVAGTLPAPPGYTGGLTFADGYLYSLENYMGNIHRLDPETGEVLADYWVPGDDLHDDWPFEAPEGIAWDGAYFWMATRAPSYLRKLTLGDPPDVTVEAMYGLGGDWPMGLTHANGNLYYPVYLGGIRVVNPANGQIIDTLPSPSDYLYSMTFDGQNLIAAYGVGGSDRVFWVISPQDGAIVETWTVPGWTDGFEAMTIDTATQTLYIGTGSGIVVAIYCDPPDDADGDGIADCVDRCPGYDDNLDCNNNAFPDGCDILNGTSEDQDGNGIPDECDPDCNGNGVADHVDIANGTSQDCQGDGIPDECQLHSMLADEAEDDCSDAGLACPGPSFRDTTVWATIDGSSTCGWEAGPDVWYLYTPAEDGTLTITVSGLGEWFYAVLSVHTGCPGNAGNQVACTETCMEGSDAELTIPVEAGADYWIRIADCDEYYPAGDFSMVLTGTDCLIIENDCNDNEVPDECDADCNENGLPEACEYPCDPGIRLADMNCDGLLTGGDIQPFIDHLLAGLYTCQADVNEDGSVDLDDVPGFAAALVNEP